MKGIKLILFIILYSIFVRVAWAQINVLNEVLFLQEPGNTLIFSLKCLPEYEIIQKANFLTIKFKNTLPGSNSRWISELPKNIFRKVNIMLKNKNLIISFKLSKPFNFKASVFETNLILNLFYPSPKKPKQIKIIGKKVKKSYVYPAYKIPQMGAEHIKIPLSKKYKGQPISVDFQNADIHAVLRMLAEIGGFNLVVSDKVKGSITLKLNKVPWDEVLDIILATNGLAMAKVGNVVRIAPISELKAESEQYKAYIDSLKKIKEEGILVTKVFKLKYLKTSEVVDQIDDIVGDKGTVTSDAVSNSIIVKASKGILEEVGSLIKKIDRPNKQVLIEARIVEIEESYTHKLGITWNLSDVTISGGTTVLGGDAIVDLGGGAGPTLGFVIGKVGRSTNILDLKLSALENEGVARIISAPRILALDNQEAEIKQGKKIPYLKLNENGVATTEFVDAVIRLKVTPHGTVDNRINLDIEVEKNTPDFGTMVNGVPTVITRYAKTRVWVNSGETLVIGGIKVKDISENTQQVPGFGRILGLGHLFKKKDRSDHKTELMVFITPKIVSVEIPGVDY